VNWKIAKKVSIEDADRLLSKSRKSNSNASYQPKEHKPKGMLGVDLEALLVEDDNKAVASVYAGYIIALGMVVSNALSGLTNKPVDDILGVLFWTFYGTLLLIIAGWINQFTVISRLVPFSTLITHQNMAIALISMGSYISAGQIVGASISGQPTTLGLDVASCTLYFVLSQIGFLIFSAAYQKMTIYDLRLEMSRGNVAAGASYALHMIAVSTMMQNSLQKSESLLMFLFWMIISGVTITLFRFFCDKLILPGERLEEEVAFDQNWGAALLVGGLQITMATCMNTFMPDICQAKYYELYLDWQVDQ